MQFQPEMPMPMPMPVSFPFCPRCRAKAPAFRRGGRACPRWPRLAPRLPRRAHSHDAASVRFPSLSRRPAPAPSAAPHSPGKSRSRGLVSEAVCAVRTSARVLPVPDRIVWRVTSVGLGPRPRERDDSQPPILLALCRLLGMLIKAIPVSVRAVSPRTLQVCFLILYRFL